jgi:hypothetical protein
MVVLLTASTYLLTIWLPSFLWNFTFKLVFVSQFPELLITNVANLLLMALFKM